MAVSGSDRSDWIGLNWHHREEVLPGRLQVVGHPANFPVDVPRLAIAVFLVKDVGA